MEDSAKRGWVMGGAVVAGRVWGMEGSGGSAVRVERAVRRFVRGGGGCWSSSLCGNQ